MGTYKSIRARHESGFYRFYLNKYLKNLFFSIESKKQFHFFQSDTIEIRRLSEIHNKEYCILYTF